MPRYAILTHGNDYTVEWAELDGYSYPVYTGCIYDEIIAATRGRARMYFCQLNKRSHVGFTDRMSIRIMQECKCDGSQWDCPICSGSKWYVPGGMWTADAEIINNA